MSNHLTAIRTGTWTDYTRGSLVGTVFTLSTRNATLLVAFIAIFDAWVGNILWSMLAFLLHRCRTLTERGDGLYHQIQALLRNTNEPFSFARDVIWVGLRWRGRANNALLRTIPLAILAVSMTLLFSLAGVWSARIASTGAVLLTGTNCGLPAPPLTMTTAKEILFNIYDEDQDTVLQRESIEYAQTCYQNPLTGGNTSILSAERFSPGASCSLYVTPALSWTNITNVECPFADKSICSVPQSEIIQLDTGYLSTLHDMGINTEPSDSITFRQVKTCSPLKTTGFSDNSFASTNLSGDYSQLALYAYGAYTAPPWISATNETAVMEWIVANNITLYYPKGAMALRNVPISLASASLLTGDWKYSERTFFPDSRLAADEYLPVSLFFLLNRALYIGDAVEDPWFNATQPVEIPLAGQLLSMYQNDVPATVLGCVEQMQICNPNAASTLCSNLNTTWTTTTNGRQAYWSGEDLNFNHAQSELAQIIVNVLVGSSFGSIAASNPQDLLLASTMVEQGFIASLPSNQWQIEMHHWMAISLAYIQRTMLYFVTGPTIEEITPYWWLASGPEALELWGTEADKILSNICGSQIIKSTAYQSFSVLGICINFILGGIFIVVGLIVRYGIPSLLCLKPMKRKAGKRYVGNRHRYAWRVDSVLQLQRMAYQSFNLGDWEHDDSSIPVTKAKQVFDRPANYENELEQGLDPKTSTESTTPLVEKRDYGATHCEQVRHDVKMSTNTRSSQERIGQESRTTLPAFHFEDNGSEDFSLERILTSTSE